MRRISLTVVAAAILLMVAAAPAMASHSWAGYHWARQSNPFTVRLGDDVTTAWDAALGGSASSWSAPTAGNPLRAAVTGGLTDPRRCRPTSGRVEVCNSLYGSNGWLGLASVWASGTHITRATVKVNDTYFRTAKYNTATWRTSVTCQELGHTFGLDHQDTSGADFHTCMDYATTPATDNTAPNNHDYEQLATSYSHLDSTSTLAALARQTPAAGAGRLGRVRDTLWVENLGNGQRRYVWVVWRSNSLPHAAPAGSS